MLCLETYFVRNMQKIAVTLRSSDSTDAGKKFVCSIGNGTASRETAADRQMLCNRDVDVQRQPIFSRFFSAKNLAEFCRNFGRNFAEGGHPGDKYYQSEILGG